MILTLDIGNTTIGIYGMERTEDGDYRVVFSEKLSTLREQRDYLPLLRRPFSRTGIALGEIEGIALSSVVPRLDAPVGQAAERLFGKPPVKIAARAAGLSYAIPQPEKVGLDRVADAAWAVRRYPLPAVTVDLGTATTFNVLDVDGTFRGGLIAAGVETGLSALSERAAQLPKVDLNGPGGLIGRNTVECMRSGAVAGTAALVDGVTARIENQLGQAVTLVLTGGWARLVEPACLHAHVYDPWLLPKGLALLYDLSAASSRGAHGWEPAKECVGNNRLSAKGEYPSPQQRHFVKYDD